MSRQFTAEDFKSENLLETFRTPWDRGRLDHTQYEKGLSVGKEFGYVTIGLNDVWGAAKPGSYISSYEKIGYHAGSGSLLKGLFDSGATVAVFRLECGQSVLHHIQRG